MDAGALAHRVVVVAEETVLQCIGHRARSIVHGAGEHTEVRGGHVVARLVVDRAARTALLPLGVLHSLHSLEVDDVGVCPLEASRMHSVVVQQHMVFRAYLRDAVERIEGDLVVAVHEVHLEALDALGGIMRHHSLGDVVPVHRVAAYHVHPTGPEDDIHALGAAIGHQGVDVHRGIDAEQGIGGGAFTLKAAAAPARIHDDVLDAVGRGEVDVGLVSGGVHTGLEVHSDDIVVVPPVPGDLAGTYPRGVVDAAGGSQALRYVAAEDVGVTGGDDDGAPRRGERAVHLGYAVLAAVGDEVQAVVAAQRDRAGHGRELRLQRVPGALQQHHRRVVLHSGVHRNGLHAAGQADRQRGDRQRVGVHLRQRDFIIVGLEGIAVALPSPVVIDIRDKCLIISGKSILHIFIVHLRGLRVVRQDAVRRGVVVSPELHAGVAPVAECHRRVVVLDHGLLVHGRGEGRADFLASRLPGSALKQFHAVDSNLYPGRLEDGEAVALHGPGQAGVGGDGGNLDFPVGGCQDGGPDPFGRMRRAADQEQRQYGRSEESHDYLIISYFRVYKNTAYSFPKQILFCTSCVFGRKKMPIFTL